MKHLSLKYAPNMSKVLDTFDMYCDSKDNVEHFGNNYLSALQELGILKIEQGIYICGNEWKDIMFQSKDRRYQSFSTKIFQEADVQTILQCFNNENSKNGYTFKQLKNILSGFSESTLLTLLDWMTELRLLELSGENYIIFESDSEEELDENQSHPDDINIKEDKYSVYEYLRKINKGYIKMNPDFQRNIVWKLEQKSRFVESALMGLPLPPIFLKKESDKKFIVVDGLQRSATLLEYLNDEFELTGLVTLTKLNGNRFSELDNIQDGLSARLEDRQLYMYVMQPSVSMSMVYDVFNRINTGGTQLTRQEIRNCVFHGQSTKLLQNIASDPIFRMSIDNGIKPLRMKDREAILRCLAFSLLDYQSEYKGSMDDFLAKAMLKINEMDNDKIESIRLKTVKTFELTTRVYGLENFRIPTDYTRGRINIAVMETIFCFFYKNLSECLLDNNILRYAFDELLHDKDYLNAVRWSTSSKVQVQCRFDKVHGYFNKIK